MKIELQKSTIQKSKSKIRITGSKSESNRLLLLQALYPQLTIKNLSNSDDSVLMQKALKAISIKPSSANSSSSNSSSSSSSTLVDIHHAGTAMRFLTAYFATKNNADVVLTGSKRMKERPIKILVDALTALGADIKYLENEGFPPLKIRGTQNLKNQVTLKANVSSQYISALLLIAPKLKNGLELCLEGEITSVPYINMTLDLLHQIGVQTNFQNNSIKVEAETSNLKAQTLVVESDWSSASYWYSTVALSDLGTEIELSSYKKASLQGDSVLANIYKDFGVETTFSDNTILLKKIENTDPKSVINLDLINAPDIAQTIAVTAFGLGLTCDLKGLHTLKIKETDRLVALKTELKKFEASITITNKSLHLKAHNLFDNDSSALGRLEQKTIDTYNDHRMAMAFAPLALKTPITINDANVVSKSYPDFWNNLQSVGYKMEIINIT